MKTMKKERPSLTHFTYERSLLVSKVLKVDKNHINWLKQFLMLQ